MLITKVLLLHFAVLVLAGDHHMFDVGIVGGGPAGISAAVSLAQQQFRVAIFDDAGAGALDNSTFITRMPVPDDLRRPGELVPFMTKSLEGYANVYRFFGRVFNIVREKPGPRGHFRLEAEGRRINARRVLLATGYEIVYPDLPGYKEAWMKVIFNDPLSDGSKGHMGAYSAAVLATDAGASAHAAMHLARLALHYAERVHIYTDRNTKLSNELSQHLQEDVTTEMMNRISVDNRRIAELHDLEILNRQSRGGKKTAENFAITIFFSDGVNVRHSFMFHWPLGRVKLNFGEELNIRLADGGLIKVDATTMETSEKGVYAAGDCVSHKRTIIKSMFTGQLAAEAMALAGVFNT